MAITIQPYTSELEPAVHAFNERLRSGGISFRFFPSATKVWLPKIEGRQIYQEFHLAVEDGVVRGGYGIKHQLFHINGRTISIAHLELPLSEGTIDKRYSLLSLQLLADAQRRYPLLYASGMGGLRNTLPKILLSMKWSIAETPFFFRVCKPGNFFRNIVYLRRTFWRRLALDIAALCGIGHLTLKPWHWWLEETLPAQAGVGVEAFSEFGEWTTELWEAGKEGYSLSAVRDRETLNILYPPENPKFLKLRLTRDGSCFGWMVMLDTQMEGHKQFGNMHVGTLVDGFALPGWEFALTHHATRFLQKRGVDLLVSNQAHEAWCGALRRCGYLTGPSNYLFAASRELAALLAPWDERIKWIHFNRGDGDGPIHL
jgi:hypothetical protein